jgi:uncharacterized membrane protein
MIDSFCPSCLCRRRYPLGRAAGHRPCTGYPFRAASCNEGGAAATQVEKTIEVEVPVRTAYNQWTQFEEFPQFMGGVDQVEQVGDALTHWVAQIGGVRREWDAAILEQLPDPGWGGHQRLPVPAAWPR